MRRLIARVSAVIIGAGALLAAAAALDGFPHETHSTLFVRCETCHLGASQAGKPLWPAPAECARCHDGTVVPTVAWTPRSGPLPSNLRFTHEAHARAFIKGQPHDTALACAQCHSTAGAKWMSVQRAIPDNCLQCHGIRTAHFDAPPAQCATCHVPFWQMPPGVTAAEVATWKAPASHAAPDFQSRHGELAAPVGARGAANQVSSACATCHAREYCVTCHVNAPEVPEIQALQPDQRSLAMQAGTIKTPASHDAADFMTTHGRKLSKKDLALKCGTCHTASSCEACHQVPPAQVRVLAVAGPGRGIGVTVTRARPENHGKDFTDGHGTIASSSPQTCAGCHVQEQCLQCHRPNGGTQGTYHPADYIARHPVAAYSRETTCSDCHNPTQFCQTCHAQNGIVSNGRFIAGQATYHDATPTFAVGHGPAARQSLETCVSCHAEKDCLICHSSTGGRRFNPHGPDFPAEKLRKANPQMCLVCHASGIPGS